MATVTTPSGVTFDEDSAMALAYYAREEGYTVGETVPEEAAELVDANVAGVLRAVGDDPQLAAQALAAELERDGGPRKTLVEKLTVLAAAGGEPTDPPAGD